MFNMKKWRHWILPLLLLAAIVVSGYWGYGEYQARQRLQNRAESQYQKSFYELSWHVDNISGQLAQLLISSSREQNILSLATLWRQAFAAQANVGSLPLALVPLSKTERFISDTGEVAFSLLRRVSQSNTGLEGKDFEVIEQLFDRSKLLMQDLSQLAAEVLGKKLSWTEVEMAAIMSNKDLEDNTIVNGFELLEKKMEEYPELQLDDKLAQVRPDVRKVRGDQNISGEKAKRIALEWWGAGGYKNEVKVSYEGVGDIPTFGLELVPEDGNDKSPVYIDVSKLDGSIIWAMSPRTVTAVNLNMNEAEKKCAEFLQAHGFGDMVPVQVEQDDNTVVFTFVPRQGEVLIYPDQVIVQVALDNGEIIGFEGTPYYMYHRSRELPQPSLSAEDVRKMVNKNFQVETIRPALITNPWGKEVLVWEVRGSYEEEKFIIFYNAANGSEEDIARITPQPKYTFEVSA